MNLTRVYRNERSAVLWAAYLVQVHGFRFAEVTTGVGLDGKRWWRAAP